MTVNGTPAGLVATITAIAVMVVIAIVYALLTAEPGRHRAPRTPLYARTADAAASFSAWLGAVTAAAVLLTFAAAIHGAAFMLRLRFTPRGAEPDKLGDLPVTEEAGQVPDTTLTDMVAIGAGTEATR